MSLMRKRRTKAQVQQLEKQILDILEEDSPQSIRHVFYRLTDPRLPEPVDKTEQGYNQVQHRLTQLRRSGKVPYGDITDATRRGYHANTYSSINEFLRYAQSLYRRDCWSGVRTLVEVWCESRSIAGTVEDTCDELAVSLFPCGGFASLTFVYDAVQSWISSGKEHIVVLYIGDYDPAGVLIDQKLEEEMRHHLSDCDDSNGPSLEVRRLGINEDQINEYDLPTKPRKKSDKRRLDIEETVEAEAMPASTMRSILTEAIESYLPEQALKVAKVAEESEKDTLWKLARLTPQRLHALPIEAKKADIADHVEHDIENVSENRRILRELLSQEESPLIRGLAGYAETPSPIPREGSL